MSYDKVIGFGYRGEDKPLLITGRELYWCKKLGVTPNIINLKDHMPKEAKEPEPKEKFRSKSDFGTRRRFIQNSPNSFLIPGQLYDQDQPLVSILLDTKRHGIPTCDILSSGYSLRWRANMDTRTGVFLQPDYNEKSTASVSDVIGGCIDRDEREFEYSDVMTAKEGYEGFVEKYRQQKNPAFCDDIGFEKLAVYAGYITARTMYGFAVKHPDHDFMLICEACEDHTQTLAQDMRITSDYKEFEFEPKQAIGTIPEFARNPDAFKLFVYCFMRDIQMSFHKAMPGSELNTKSKADMAREHLHNHAIISEDHVRELGLAQRFRKHGGYDDANPLVAERGALMLGHSLDETIDLYQGQLFHIAGKLIREKRCEQRFIHPDEGYIGYGRPTVPLIATHYGHSLRH